jgi:glycosyltransferase involved in cell wall biosynthesis
MKISVITATYNSAKTIKSTIESVLAQSYADIEYIIVDGNSHDETMQIVKSYEPSFRGRMKYVSEPDKGIYDAMNKGIGMATGDVVGILNSDDFYTSDDVVQRIVEAFDEDLDAVYGDIHFVNPDNLKKCVRYYSSAVFRPSLLRFGFMPAHPSFYVRKRIYNECGKYSLEYKIAADYDMMVRFFYNHGIKAKYIKKDFVTMRMGGASTRSIKNIMKANLEDVKACNRNGLYTNLFMICLKYLIKVFGLRMF